MIIEIMTVKKNISINFYLAQSQNGSSFRTKVDRRNVKEIIKKTLKKQAKKGKKCKQKKI